MKETMMMKKRNANICYYFLATLMVLLTSMKTLRASSATSLEIAGNFQFPCNGTIHECMGNGGLADDDEYLMESDVSRRILAQQSITYKALGRSPFCSAKIYGDCIKQSNIANRPCAKYNRCQRSIS